MVDILLVVKCAQKIIVEFGDCKAISAQAKAKCDKHVKLFGDKL